MTIVTREHNNEDRVETSKDRKTCTNAVNSLAAKEQTIYTKSHDKQSPSIQEEFLFMMLRFSSSPQEFLPKEV